MKRLLFVLPALACLLAFAACEKTGNESTDFLMWDSAVNTYDVDKGGEVAVSATITASGGLNTISVAIPAWSVTGAPKTDVIEVTGSPKTYEFTYTVKVDADAQIGQKTVAFTMKDHNNKEVKQDVIINVQSDKVLPVLTIITPENNADCSPDEDLVINITATDDLKMKSLAVVCEELELSETAVPEADPKSVTINKTLSLTGRNGTFVITVTATDDQLNVTTETRTIQILYSSKPRITANSSHSLCGVAGGTMPLDFKIESNPLHPIVSVSFKCSTLSLDKNYTPAENQWSYTLTEEFPVVTGDDLRNVPFTITAKNDIDEIGTYTGSLDIIKDVYMIGRATIAKEKQDMAVLMAKETGNSNVFTGITWVDVAGDGIKFLSKQSWEDFNWGLDANGNVVSPDSEFIPIGATGYHKVTFNPATREYTIAPYTVTDEPKSTMIYLNGHSFYLWDGSSWKMQEDWGAVEAFKTYPGNPHRFYIDIKTGLEGSNVCLFKIWGQETYADGEIFYSYHSEDMDGNGWDYHWWHFVGPLYIKDSFYKIPYYREDGRKETVMRLTVDTYLMYMSWMPLKEQFDAGWTIYPEVYTGW
jgi:hypothetical protein